MNVFDKQYNFEERFVAFIDILGFNAIINNIEANPHEDNPQFHSIKSILNFMSEETEESHYRDDLPVYEEIDGKVYMYELGHPRLTYISDCIIISADGNLNGFKGLSQKIHKIISDLAIDGIFCRGAITKGKLFHHDKFLFGSAYVKAFKLESKAIYPRIIVDPDIYNFFDYSKIDVPLSRFFYSKDIDGLFYLNLITYNYCPPYCGDWASYLLRVRVQIIKNLNDKDKRINTSLQSATNQDEIEKIFKKYDWLYQEFNRNLNKYKDGPISNLREVPIIQLNAEKNKWE